MKTAILKIMFVTLVVLGLNGCYTIIWSPDTEFPNEYNSDLTTIYYGVTIYGPYYYYYDYPWWLDVTPPSTGPVTKERSDKREIGKLRDTGERETPTRVPELPPPTREKPPTIDNGSSNNSGGSSSESTVRSTPSRNSSSGSGNSTRNNNGGRSSGGRK